jgi:hypothetical protein
MKWAKLQIRQLPKLVQPLISTKVKISNTMKEGAEKRTRADKMKEDENNP